MTGTWSNPTPLVGTWHARSALTVEPWITLDGQRVRLVLPAGDWVRVSDEARVELMLVPGLALEWRRGG